MHINQTTNIFITNINNYIVLIIYYIYICISDFELFSFLCGFFFLFHYFILIFYVSK